VTRFGLEIHAMQIANGIERRILANAQLRCADGVPPDQIVDSMRSELEHAQHWIAHEYRDQLVAWLQSLEQ
jgi:hypothetical protein